jgi:hypothetical protein
MALCPPDQHGICTCTTAGCTYRHLGACECGFTVDRLGRARALARQLYLAHHNPDDPRWSRCDGCTCPRSRP